MNIPKVTHTPRVEAVYEKWAVPFRASVRREGRDLILACGETMRVRSDAIELLACLAAALGCEVVQRGAPDKQRGEPDKPSPARPEYVKVTDLRGDKTQPLTVGKVYKVEDWYGVSPRVRHDLGGLWCLSNRGETPASIHNTLASWVPADAPATCEPTDAQVDAAYRVMVRRHGWLVVEKETVRSVLKAAMEVKS